MAYSFSMVGCINIWFLTFRAHRSGKVRNQMLIQPTIEKLYAMRLRGMAEAFQQQQEDANIHSLSFEERLGLLIDRQWNWRQNRALDRRLRNGRLQGPACIEDIDYRAPRG